MANNYDNPDDDFMRDLDGIFDRRDAASRPAGGSAQYAPGNDDGINWDDYNFNFANPFCPILIVSKQYSGTAFLCSTLQMAYRPIA